MYREVPCPEPSSPNGNILPAVSREMGHPWRDQFPQVSCARARTSAGLCNLTTNVYPCDLKTEFQQQPRLPSVLCRPPFPCYPLSSSAPQPLDCSSSISGCGISGMCKWSLPMAPFNSTQLVSVVCNLPVVSLLLLICVCIVRNDTELFLCLFASAPLNSSVSSGCSCS